MQQCAVLEVDKDAKLNIDKIDKPKHAIEWAPSNNPGFQNCPAVPKIEGQK